MNLSLLFIFGFLLLASCGERSPLQFETRQDRALGASVDFTGVKNAILKPKCISCHAHYDSYEATKNDLTKIIATVEENRMPKNSPPLSDIQKKLLSDWNEAGAPRGESTETVDDGILRPEWKSLVSKVFGPRCIQCHNPAGEARFLNLSSRQSIWKERERMLNFEEPEKSYLIQVISNPEEPMPPLASKLPQLTANEIEIIQQWIKAGIP